MRRCKPLPPADPSFCREPSKELISVLKKEITTILTEETFDIPTLSVVQRFASHAKALLSTLDPRLGMIEPGDCGPMPSFVGPAPMASGWPSSPMVPSSSEETYGAALSRELVAAAAKKTPADPVALVNAIAVARERNLPDIAERLEKELLGVPNPVAAPELAAEASDDKKEAV